MGQCMAQGSTACLQVESLGRQEAAGAKLALLLALGGDLA